MAVQYLRLGKGLRVIGDSGNGKSSREVFVILDIGLPAFLFSVPRFASFS